MSFSVDLYVELKPGRDDEIWVLTKSLSYYSSVLQKWVVVPADFETDLSSVPRIPLVFWFWGGRAHKEGVLHDYLFCEDSNPVVSFSTANLVFLEAMKSRDKPWNVRFPMYAGVVVGGYFAYHKRRVGDSL